MAVTQTTEETSHMIQNLLLRLVARSSDSLVSFISGLSTKLDDMLEAHDAKVKAISAEQEKTRNTAVLEVERIKREADETIAQFDEQIAEEMKSAKIVASIKQALPTA